MGSSIMFGVQNGKSVRKKRKSAALAAAIAFGVTLVPQPAHANYTYPYFYSGLGSLLYPLSYMAYPFFGRVPTSTYYAPYWFGRMAQRSVTGAYGYPPYGGAYNNPYQQNNAQNANGQNGNGGGQNANGANDNSNPNANTDPSNNPYGVEQYSDEEPANSPRKRKRPKRVPPPQGVDQVNHANWLDPAAPDAALLDAPAGGGTAQSLATTGTLSAAPQLAPPVAKHHGFHQKKSSKNAGSNQPSASTNASSGLPLNPASFGAGGSPGSAAFQGAPAAAPAAASCAPLADGFINHINTKYGGDIKAALFNPETRSYARVLGLVNEDSLFHADLSESRVQLIKQIMQDPSLDSVSKVQAVKIMIGAKAAR